MNPKPLVSLKNFTVPLSEAMRMNPDIEFGPGDMPEPITSAADVGVRLVPDLRSHCAAERECPGNPGPHSRKCRRHCETLQ
jgi:hypothetical protein